jgi:hypothetical protein
MSDIVYDVKVDWQATDWSVTPNFSQAIDDITADVQHIRGSRGQDLEQGNSPAATLELILKPGLVSKYSPYNTGSVLYPNVRPWLPVRVKATYDATEYAIFAGWISRISINPHRDVQSVYLYVTDGSDLLARQLVTQDYESAIQMSDGDAVGSVLDAAGWNSGARILGSGGDTLFNYPAVGVY